MGGSQEEDKKEAAAELLKYTDTFRMAWRRGLGSYDATPAAIENAVGKILSPFSCYTTPNRGLFFIIVRTIALDVCRTSETSV